MEFDRRSKCPVPEVIDVRLGKKGSKEQFQVNGDKKVKSAMRFGGRPRLSNEMDNAL